MPVLRQWGVFERDGLAGEARRRGGSWLDFMAQLEKIRHTALRGQARRAPAADRVTQLTKFDMDGSLESLHQSPVSTPHL